MKKINSLVLTLFLLLTVGTSFSVHAVNVPDNTDTWTTYPAAILNTAAIDSKLITVLPGTSDTVLSSDANSITLTAASDKAVPFLLKVPKLETFFGTALTNGVYYIELISQQNFKDTTGQLYMEFQDGKGKIASVGSINPTNYSIKQNLDAPGSYNTMKWVTGEKINLKNDNSENKIGYLFDTNDCTLKLFFNGVEYFKDKKMYFGNSDVSGKAIGINAFNTEFKLAAKGSTFTLKSIKAYKKNSTVDEKIKLDMNLVTDEFVFGGLDKNSVLYDLKLPTSPMENGSTVTWVSSSPEIISNSGKFLKTPDEETPVTLTGTFKNGNETRTKEINFKVSPGYGWNNVENVDFTIAPTSIDAKYKIGGVEGYNVTNDANGIKATRTGVDSKADSFSINVNFKVPLKEGIYYIEYEYNDSLSGTGASLWSSIDGDKGEGITFQQNKAAIQIPARTTPEQTTTGAWGPAISGHKTGVYEKIGFLYNSAEASFLPYLNANFDPNNLPNLNIPASYAKLYTRFAGTTQLKGIRSVVKTVGQNGWIGIKGLKVWKQEKVIPYKINSLDLVSSTVNITKSTDKNAFAVVCLYKNNTDGTLSLEKTTIKDITTLKTGQNQGQDIAFENAFVGEYDVIKVFLWNNMSDLKPLSSVYSQNK